MVSKTNEQALESAIERALTGTCLEYMNAEGKDFQDPSELYRSGHGYYVGKTHDFNAKFAIDEVRFWHFLETTQKEELDKIKRSADWRLRILNRYDNMVKRYGILNVLRRGLKVDDANFTMFYQLPMASSSESVKDNFRKNEFSETRQVQYNLDKRLEEIDMVIFINGIAISTLELKNAWTGQTARVNGIKQYKQDRDINQPLLNFGRCIVHFAVDTDEVYMCTKLAGEKSFFLPFNMGNNNSKGNPVNPTGHRTDYLWNEILTRESLANIIEHYVRFDGKPSDTLSKRRLFFPRYHQLDVVRKILKHASEHGVGQTYLIQHSAGSGKSNSITWAAYQLIETYPAHKDLKGSKGLDYPLFDSVIVVTDRRLLDKQIRDNIKEFSEIKNIVAPAYSSKELRQNLEQGKKIIITTIQKFPFIVEGIADLSDKRFAVIIDEAHSSQSGTAADKMNQAMGTGVQQDASDDCDEPIDTQDVVLQAMKSRKMKDNASYLAFTATPKPTTLERFGTKQDDGTFKPFHLYSMKQAIEEGFILDVLANYTIYKSYYEIKKSIQENPTFESKKAQSKLSAYVEQERSTIAVKADIMMDHFISKVFSTKKLKGKAKAMVLTQDISCAIKYYQAISRILSAKGNPFKIAVAFSGKKLVNGIEYTEGELNGFPEKDTKDKFASDDYRILVVANKYLTGFDQPKLCTMYVDKKLQNVVAVQALSRLNRSANDLGKKTEDLFILDFFNSIDDIKKSFDPYYTATSLSEATDVNVLHEIKETLDATGIYEWSEVEDFVTKYFQNVDAQELSPIIDSVASRFNQLLQFEDKDKADYKIKAKQFVKIYGQMASIIPFEVLEWEKLFWFLKFLIPKMIVRDANSNKLDDLLDSVDLSTYALQRSRLNEMIVLDDTDSEIDPNNPLPRGAHDNPEQDLLSEIIELFNERHYTGWDATPEEQRVKFVALATNVIHHPDFSKKVANNPDSQNSGIAFDKILDDVMRADRSKALDLYKLYAKDESFQHTFNNAIRRIVDAGAAAV